MSVPLRQRPCARRQSRGRGVIQYPRASGPRVKCRTFESLRKIMAQGALYPPARESWGPDEMAYLGVESEHQPNLTMVPPWKTSSGLHFGSTMGHEQVDPSPDPLAYLEVYQAVNYAAMLIDLRNKKTMKLFILTPGEKVAVPNGCIMTIFNLGTEAAVLLDLANPKRHQANKLIQSRSGPVLAMRYEAGCVRVRINPAYVDRADGYGVSNPRTVEETAIPAASARPKAIARALCSPRGRRNLALLGIEVHRPDMAILATRMGVRKEALEDSLEELRKNDLSHEVVRYLFDEPRRDQSVRLPAETCRRRVAVVGGWGTVARERIVPIIARNRAAGFVCSEHVPEPEIALDGARPHPYEDYFGPQRQGQFYQQLRQGAFRAVYLSTPPRVTGKLLSRLAGAPVQLVVADKPWWPSYRAARAAAGRLAHSQVEFRFFDHYLYRAAVQAVFRPGITSLLGGPIDSIEIRLWESAAYRTAAQGETGILADLAIHALSLAHAFLPNACFRVTAARAARHAESTDYDTETFCSLVVDARDGQRRIPIQVSAGKYMPSSFAKKEMVIAGNGRQLHFDLERDTADLVHRMGAERVWPDDQGEMPAGYEVLVRKLVTGDPEIGLGLDEAISVHKVLHEARGYFPADLPRWTAQACASLPDWFQRSRARAA